MLISGIANPAGETEGYNGLHLKDGEIDEIISGRQMIGIPVKIEHKGVGVGTVVSAFKDEQGRLNCILDITDDEIEGAIAQQWVRDNTASELSLGYTVDINQSEPQGRLSAGRKKVLEVSLVRKGARKGCHIYSHPGKHPPGDPGLIKDWREAFGHPF
ncbi:hypothetical protein GUITHDRAFT_117146 [Guillardia theta CCMP2712]|uniref:Uncharacterized protein n=1 Tax=Guillardia theta (strain CCMP2712) TaxID=905079 RepID=L1IKE7_GUITC|nr:hypothetical protein GUITHDRAFT_117146 [Guillardia theta CCMP2712]EKX36716.1 hypothetical protein GUITHDRAFT_117146 [Guillardia theta CCMP2712]|eukprot:XP_005823696.1 hypothetical protein GUITHDRAFT_117146 [Guillardia theta CCMP2712]